MKKLKKGIAIFSVALLFMSMASTTIIQKAPKDCVEYAEEVEDNMTDGECDAEIASLAYDWCMTMTDINDD